MEKSIFRALPQRALSEREHKSLYGGNVCGCARRSNSTMDKGSAYHAGNLNSRGASMTETAYLIRKVVMLILLCTIYNCAFAQLPPAPQTLEQKRCIDTTEVECVYSFKFRFNRSAAYSEDIRKVQIGRKYIKDFSYVVFHYDSLATERMKKGLQSQNIPSQTYPCEITTDINTRSVSEKYRLMLNAGVLCYTTVTKPFDWQFIDADTMIASHNCNKAKLFFAGRNYTAWYTTEVAVPYGPYKFYGLPGLIMRIEDENGLFVWDLNKVEFVQKPIYTYTYENEQTCSATKAKQIIRKMMTSPMSFLQSIGTKMMVRRSDGSFGPPSHNSEQQEFEPLELE